MLLIYAHTITPRLAYTCQFIFGEVLQISHVLTNDTERLNKHEGPSIHYGDKPQYQHAFFIQSAGLLFESDIQVQKPSCFETNGYKALFRTPEALFPFDIFSATFYLISRYEEYLPHEKDMYGRYAHTNAIAYQEKFLPEPLVNIWINDLTRSLKKQFPSFETSGQPFSFIPTYDIDIAWSYRHKGFWRNLGGFIKSPSKSRIRVLMGKEQDPFDVYKQLDELHQLYGLQPIYFFLMAKHNGELDKNISPYHPALQQLIREHANWYQVGIHPSWQSGENINVLIKEKELLSRIIGHPVQYSRQHYIRFDLPTGYRRLITAGITDDYSMGYGSINGFRASVATPFYWYDLEKDETTGLRIHPFCYMEANSLYEQQLNPEQALEEMLMYFNRCKSVNGTFISIWHNHILGRDEIYSGWNEMYGRFLQQISGTE